MSQHIRDGAAIVGAYAEYDGPRRVRHEELRAVARLDQICFGGSESDPEPTSSADDVPPRNGVAYVLAYRGEPVSKIDTFHERLSVYDGIIRVGSIGGVCTHPDHREKGLASYLLDGCTRQLAQEGARLMLISGGRGVYTRLGSVPHGRFVQFCMGPGQGQPWRPAPADLVVRPATAADALACTRLYEAEPVHFVRRHARIAEVLGDPTTNPYVHAEPWIIERAGQAAAYLFLGIDWGQAGGLAAGIRHVGEYAGSRLALADALHPIMALRSLQQLSWLVAWQDAELIQLLEESGHRGTPESWEGNTLRIIDFPGFMRDLRPVLQARLDETLLRGLRFEQRGPLLGGSGADRLAIVRGPERLELDGAAMTRLVMGSIDGDPGPAPLTGALAEVCRALFPLPSFLAGLNYH